MDKLTAIKIKYDDGTYSDEIPISVLSENVEWDSTHTLVDVLGSIDVDVTGTIQDQISQLFNEKVSNSDMQNYITNSMPTYITTWLNTNVNPVGSAVVVDSSLTVNGAAADAKVVGDKLTQLKNDIDGLAQLKNDIDELIEKEISPNLYNPSDDSEGKQLANAGYEMTNTDYNTSGYIKISSLTSVYIAANVSVGRQSLRVCYYNSSKTNLGSDTTQAVNIGVNGTVPNNTLYALTIPENATYIRFHYFNATVTNIYVGAYMDNYSYVPYGSVITVLPSDETKAARGNYETLGDRLDAISDSIIFDKNVVEYWGDSLTQGNQDGTRISRKSVLSTLLGEDWTVNNYGVGGEKSNAISARASGIYAVITPDVTIPADGSTVDLTGHLTDVFGNVIGFGSGIYSSAYGSWDTVNPCHVNGVECILQRTNASSPITIRRTTSGEAITINRPTYIVMNSATFDNGAVLLICAGQNEGFDRSADELISQIDGIIEARGSDRYIVYGIPHSLYGSTWQAPINAALKNKYGKKYYDIEAYMKTPIYNDETIVTSYAMQDAGLTPTAADLEAIGRNQYPPSIMYDGVHFNQYGYTVWANREYQVGKWLGYWN